MDLSGVSSRANPAQEAAIRATEGPVLIIAGPGSGKTFTLVEQVWTVPMDFVLQPGATVLIHALVGQNDGGNLYSGFGSNIWNNSEPDPAVLLDGGGVEVSRYP